MNYTYLHYQTALANLYGIGPRKARALLHHLESVELLFHSTPKELAQLTGLKADFFRKMKREDALKTADKIIAFNARHSIDAIYFDGPKYSRKLNQCVDAPIQMYSKGKIDLNSTRFVAIVGTRSATEYGREICKNLIASFRGNNIVVVSGLAHGIDSYVHRYCIEFGIPTIGVLGHGLDRIYPASHRSLAQQMLENGGLLTEFGPGTIPDRENFPKRNRIVAGLCDATVVVESKISGGSLITAHIANSYNRDVFAFPGPIYTPTSQGCNALISSSKAHLLEEPSAFLKQMQWESTGEKVAANQLHCFPELSSVQQEIATEIHQNPQIQLDLLAARLALPISTLQVEILQLKLGGVVEEIAGRRFQVHYAFHSE